MRISARITSIDSEHFLALADRARQQAAQMSLPMQVTGTNYLLAQMSRALVHNQVSSLACAVVMILGTIYFQQAPHSTRSSRCERGVSTRISSDSRSVLA